ncbi:MAG TPA: ECF-type sigma factor [Nevskiaceae bacterium]|nr:ECF-type sigma factor [Nevskiaceae bacterium]
MGEITQLLRQASAGEADARHALFQLMYGELQRVARSKLARESTLSQLDTSALVHEIYIKLSNGTALPSGDRRSFYAYAASAMRSVIVDYARKRNAAKRGSGIEPITLQAEDEGGVVLSPDVEAVDRALQQLKAVDEQLHQIVELRYFAGLTVEEIAEALEVSPTTVKREWRRARAFLFRKLEG